MDVVMEIKNYKHFLVSNSKCNTLCLGNELNGCCHGNQELQTLLSLKFQVQHLMFRKRTEWMLSWKSRITNTYQKANGI